MNFNKSIHFTIKLVYKKKIILALNSLEITIYGSFMPYYFLFNLHLHILTSLL